MTMVWSKRQTYLPEQAQKYMNYKFILLFYIKFYRHVFFPFQINLKKMAIARHEKKKSIENCLFSDDKIEAMKRKAQEISKIIVLNSKPTINQQIVPSDIGINHNSRVDNKSLQENKNKEFSTLMNTESANIPSCSKTSIVPNIVISSNSTISKRKHSKGRKKLSKKFKKLEIPYLVKSDIYQEENVDKFTSKKQDDYVLKKLFNKSGMLDSTYY